MANPLKTSIAIRAYSERPEEEALGSRGPYAQAEGSDYVLVVDTETAVDASQRMRFGFFQVRRGEALERAGVFYDPAAMSLAEQELLQGYAAVRGLEVMTVAEFRTDVFLKYGYVRMGVIVGFNLPFDISRLAIHHGPARGRDMRGAFSFDLTGRPDDPRVRVKHLNTRAALISFGAPFRQDTPRSWRKRRKRVPVYRGRFLDLRTCAAALLSTRFNLRSLANHLGTPTQKRDTDEHGTISEAYLDYARDDVQVTWECYRALVGKYAEHHLGNSLDRILSEASIGKAYLQQMGITPFLGCDPSFSRERLGEILCAYYGGRAEVRIRRLICEVLYCDFKSMYPTVNALMGLWSFVIGHGMTVEDTKSDTQAFLDSVTVQDAQHPEMWPKLCTLVSVTPQQDILPVRAPYDGETYTIGLNALTASEPLWYTLADCIVSKLLTGRSPRIEKALTYRPGPPQEGLRPTTILGLADYAVDPRTQDFFTELINLRDRAKANGDPAQHALKIIANSTAYGIFVEVIRDNAPKSEKLDVFGPHSERRRIRTKAIEYPGRYFHPLLGALITGAARLMLGIAEKLTLDARLDWAFCDTDSLAITRPEGMSRDEFRARAQKVVDWFVPLNPYRKSGSILKKEDHNFGIDSKAMEPLYCFAISAKRNALFNLHDGKPVLRKASAHGLGHLVDPYSESQLPADIPPPEVPLKDMGVRRWQYDLWQRIIAAALCGDPDRVPIEWDPALQTPAAIRYSASSPPLLTWLDRWNAGKSYDQQVRPFAFLLAFMPRKGLYSPFTAVLIEPARGRPVKTDHLAPIAPYDTDPARALGNVFDRLTGRPVSPEKLKTYAEVLAQYHLSPEAKFENGNFWDRGRTERRHVIATGFVWIGKEANQVGESGEADPIWSAVEEFTAPEDVYV